MALIYTQPFKTMLSTIGTTWETKGLLSRENSRRPSPSTAMLRKGTQTIVGYNAHVTSRAKLTN
jgi:hypothetical protein